MNNNPYEAPRSGIESLGAPKQDVGWLTSALGVISLLPGAFMLLGIPLMWRELLSQFSTGPLTLGVGLALGVVSLFGGGLLLALRPACVPLLGISFLAGTASAIAFHPLSVGAFVWPAAHLAAAVYAVWLWRRGALRSRPNNSSKPTPLRGAA